MLLSAVLAWGGKAPHLPDAAAPVAREQKHGPPGSSCSAYPPHSKSAQHSPPFAATPLPTRMPCRPVGPCWWGAMPSDCAKPTSLRLQARRQRQRTCSRGWLPCWTAGSSERGQFLTLEAVHTGLDGGKTSACAAAAGRQPISPPACCTISTALRPPHGNYTGCSSKGTSCAKLI